MEDTEGRNRAAFESGPLCPVAVPEICCSLSARQISTAATRPCSLFPPPAALAGLPTSIRFRIRSGEVIFSVTALLYHTFRPIASPFLNFFGFLRIFAADSGSARGCAGSEPPKKGTKPKKAPGGEGGSGDVRHFVLRRGENGARPAYSWRRSPTEGYETEKNAGRGRRFR